jgi:hypothetical protein
MPEAVLDIVASTSIFEALPFSSEQRSSRTSALLILMLLIPGIGLALVPIVLLVAFAADTFGTATDNPGAAVQALVGILVWAFMFLVPATRMLQRFVAERRIEIDGSIVIVTDRGLFGARIWHAPLHSFRGIAHHVRSNLSGVRHELVLVHPQSRRSLLLHTGDQISRQTLERASGLLRLPEVSARELYRLGVLGRAIGVPRLAAQPETEPLVHAPEPIVGKAAA